MSVTAEVTPKTCRPELSHRWGVILAGGDGRRLQPLTRRIAGDERPKQFCAILGRETLLDQTRSRISPAIRPEQTLVVVTSAHEPFYAGHLALAHPSLLLVQPSNRGTTPAIVYALLRIREFDSSAIVGIFPSDHHFDDDEAFTRCVKSAMDAVEDRAGMVLLLGIAPEGPEPGYGWIEPGVPLMVRPPYGALFRVNSFWEKPSRELAAELMKRGCLWNSFVMLGRVDSFLKLIRRATPYLLQRFESIEPAFFTAAEREALADLYSGLTSSNFSEDVLSVSTSRLGVIAARNLGWVDMGETDRVLSLFPEGFSGLMPDLSSSATHAASELKGGSKRWDVAAAR